MLPQVGRQVTFARSVDFDQIQTMARKDPQNDSKIAPVNSPSAKVRNWSLVSYGTAAAGLAGWLVEHYGTIVRDGRAGGELYIDVRSFVRSLTTHYH